MSLPFLWILLEPGSEACSGHCEEPRRALERRHHPNQALEAEDVGFSLSPPSTLQGSVWVGPLCAGLCLGPLTLWLLDTAPGSALQELQGRLGQIPEPLGACLILCKWENNAHFIKWF